MMTANGLPAAVQQARGGSMGWGLANVNVLLAATGQNAEHGDVSLRGGPPLGAFARTAEVRPMHFHFAFSTDCAGMCQPRRDDFAQAVIKVRGRVAVDFDEFCSGTRRRAGYEVFKQTPRLLAAQPRVPKLHAPALQPPFLIIYASPFYRILLGMDVALVAFAADSAATK
jgi:hypothetical protein